MNDAEQMGSTGEAQEDAPSWGRTPLSEIVRGIQAGEIVGATPSLFVRTDGACLLYPARVHSFHGESESGKSLVVQAECARLVNEGLDVLYIDFESDAAEVVLRLLEMGADPGAVERCFHYHRPEGPPTSSDAEGAAWDEMLSRRYALAVIDGVTDSIGIFGYSTINDDIAAWQREVPNRIAGRTGAATVVIDHVARDTSTRGRFAIGGQHKLAGLSGAAYTVEVSKGIGRGMCGEVVLRVGKDRPGRVRPNCVGWRKSDKTQEAARIIVDSTNGKTVVTVDPPRAGSSYDADSPVQNGFRPTALMERVSLHAESRDEPLTKSALAEEIPGKKQGKLRAIAVLIQEGYLRSTPAGGKAKGVAYVHQKPYRQRDDPQSDSFVNIGNRSDVSQ